MDSWCLRGLGVKSQTKDLEFFGGERTVLGTEPKNGDELERNSARIGGRRCFNRRGTETIFWLAVLSHNSCKLEYISGFWQNLWTQQAST